jgi:hypothetical protein
MYTNKLGKGLKGVGGEVLLLPALTSFYCSLVVRNLMTTLPFILLVAMSFMHD